MGACQYGATKIAGNPSLIRPSDADMQRWFGDLYYKWWGPLTVFMGQTFDVDAIIASNPDMPTPPAELDVKNTLMGDAGIAYDLQVACRKWIEYSIFYENSLCNGEPSDCQAPPWDIDEQGTWNPDHFWYLPHPAGVTECFYRFDLYTRGLNDNVGALKWGPTMAGPWTEIERGGPGGDDTAGTWNWGGGIKQLPSGGAAGVIQYQVTSQHPGVAVGGHLQMKYCRQIVTATPPSITMPTFPTIPPYPLQTGCTTDDICRLVQMTLNKLDVLYDPIKATQRTAAPQAYLLGTPINVVADGSSVVGQMVGCIVHVTSVPPGWGRGTGADPRRLPSLMSVRFGTADGATRGVGVRHEHQLVPNDAPYADRILYTPRPFVTATITPLLRES